MLFACSNEATIKVFVVKCNLVANLIYLSNHKHCLLLYVFIYDGLCLHIIHVHVHKSVVYGLATHTVFFPGYLVGWSLVGF